MASTLYYFSGTGNSYAIAKQIKSKMRDCELVAIISVYNLEHVSAKTENIGFVFPLYYQSMPKVVMDFIGKIDLNTSKYIFAVVTRGGKGYQGGALRHMQKMLTAKGKELSAGFYIHMPENYIPLLKVPPKEKHQKMFEKAAKKVEKIADLVNSKKTAIETEYTSFMRPLMHNSFIKKLGKIDTGFFVTEGCNSCGICQKVCHFNNIKIVEGIPKWQHNCQFCLACINYCPKKAIEYKKGTRGKDRYYHPDVPASKYVNI